MTRLAFFRRSVLALTVAMGPMNAGPFAAAARAETYIRCESRGDRYTECPIVSHGYVRLSRNLSNAPCTQGRTWDYDKRRIWVDDGCRAEFVVEDRSGSSGGSGAAVAAIAVVGLLALAAANQKKKEKEARDRDDYHYDDNYGRGGHSSYLPSWMVGEFSGYNMNRGADVRMTIRPDGRATAWINGQSVDGYVNDERLYFGDHEFYVDRAGDGFNTRQVGDSGNQVHYSRR
ncbi:DUF3011 domain-containing protein [Phenylobacterium sp.]|uniref:DUF3011 domain-containing protein n=1 Tax=Phenylobacterium sp. TaxID=1871053 RepID=UPI00286C02AB|nr:DUF3011 domain-containing protein [Phenylobacterium sp.]